MLKLQKKVCVICGPTAVGKTSLALQVATSCNGELISADSRQVYRYMDIGTGKDIPAHFTMRTSIIRNSKNDECISNYSDGSINIWGYDLVNPDDNFSVFHFKIFAEKILSDMFMRGKLPIIVGGTGQYIDVLFSPPASIGIPRNDVLRRELQTYIPKKLLFMLNSIDSDRVKSMNTSDRNNPRRLIRAIEIALYKKHHVSGDYSCEGVSHKNMYDALWIGLNFSDRKTLYEQIDRRVMERIHSSFHSEYARLIQKQYIGHVPKHTIGYREWDLYTKGLITRDEAIKRWKFAEHAYARRQMTWFRKYSSIQWFDASDIGYKKRVVDKICQWYTKK